MDNTKLKDRMSGKVQELQQSTGNQNITVTSAPETSLAPVDSSYLALTNNALDIIRANLKSQPLTLDLFDIVKSPSGVPPCLRFRDWQGMRPKKNCLASFWTTPPRGHIGIPLIR